MDNQNIKQQMIDKALAFAASVKSRTIDSRENEAIKELSTTKKVKKDCNSCRRKRNAKPIRE